MALHKTSLPHGKPEDKSEESSERGGRGELDGQQDIEQLKKRYDDLRTRKIQAETNRATSERRLADLKAQALRDYGTDDLGELKQKLAEMKLQNEKLRSDYQRHLDGIESALKQVDERFASSTDAG